MAFKGGAGGPGTDAPWLTVMGGFAASREGGASEEGPAASQAYDAWARAE
jgi:hypothetical protein